MGIDIFGKFTNRQAIGKLIDYKDIDGTPTNELKSVILSTSGWLDNTQIVSVEGVTANNNILISPNGEPTAYAEAGVYCSAQAQGMLTFKCTDTPTTDIMVSVFIGESIAGENVITVDDEMSDESTNPVQNKVIKKYIDENAGGGSKLYKHTYSIDMGVMPLIFDPIYTTKAEQQVSTPVDFIKKYGQEFYYTAFPFNMTIWQIKGSIPGSYVFVAYTDEDPDNVTMTSYSNGSIDNYAQGLEFVVYSGEGAGYESKLVINGEEQTVGDGRLRFTGDFLTESRQQVPLSSIPTLLCKIEEV